MKNFKIQTKQSGTNMKSAFTLAEVLITLAIIGVVAAMTLPTLIQKYQKRVLGERFKQSISILSQGFQKMMADEEVTDFYETTLGRSDNWNMNRKLFEKYFKVAGDFGDDDSLSAKRDEMELAMNEAIDKYCESHDGEECGRYVDESWNKLYNGESDLGSSVVNLYQLALQEECNPLMLFLQNGLTIGGMKKVEYHDYQWGIDLESIFLIIDTNGDAKPNKGGYDRFLVTILDTGLVVPYNSKISSNYTRNKILKFAENICQIVGDCSEDDKYAILDDVVHSTYNDKVGYNNDYIDSILSLDYHDDIKESCVYYALACSGYLYDNNFVIDY